MRSNVDSVSRSKLKVVSQNLLHIMSFFFLESRDATYFVTLVSDYYMSLLTYLTSLSSPTLFCMLTVYSG